MNNLVLNATRVARHSLRYFLVLCAWCDRGLATVGGPLRRCDCDQPAELLAAARSWASRPAFSAEPDPPASPRRRGARRSPRAHMRRAVASA